MQRTLMFPILAAVLLSAGCVSKGEYESAQAELELCQEEKAQSEAQVITWERRFDRESQRWESMQASISEQVPQALSELHEERERIIELVPEQVQTEVEAYLQEYFGTVMRGFDHMVADNREIKLELATTRKALEDVGADTQAISSSIDTTLAQERSRLEAERAQREALAARLSEMVAFVTQFDNTRVNCKQCPDRLKLNRKEREAIAAFHGELVSRLSELQASAGSMGIPRLSPSGETPPPMPAEGEDSTEAGG